MPARACACALIIVTTTLLIAHCSPCPIAIPSSGPGSPCFECSCSNGPAWLTSRLQLYLSFHLRNPALGQEWLTQLPCTPAGEAAGALPTGDTLPAAPRPDPGLPATWQAVCDWAVGRPVNVWDEVFEAAFLQASPSRPSNALCCGLIADAYHCQSLLAVSSSRSSL